jgi:hypothetical protein
VTQDTTRRAIVRRNQFRAACPGIGWETEQRKPSSTIGGRSPRWQVVTADPRTGVSEPADEDTVIIRGSD